MGHRFGRRIGSIVCRVPGRVQKGQKMPGQYGNSKVTVQRIQDTNNRLTDDYAKTSRPCPPFCIQPTKWQMV